MIAVACSRVSVSEIAAGTREIFEDKWTVSEKMEFVLTTISVRGGVKFSELFATAANRSEVVCTFLALLELIRLKQLACVQPEPFDEIVISRAQLVIPATETVVEMGTSVENVGPETENPPAGEEAPPS